MHHRPCRLPSGLLRQLAACSLALAGLGASPGWAQSLGDALRRAAEDALRRAAQQAQQRVQQPPPQPPGQPPQATSGGPPPATAAPAPSPASQPSGAALAAAVSPVQGLEVRLADTPRTIDLRGGTPPELANRYFPQHALIILANPYVPADRRFIDGIGAMACHPQGGLVVSARTRRWEPSPQRGEGREYVENGSGLWRVEADGRMLPLWVPIGRQVDDSFSNCDAPAARARLPGSVQLAVEPGGGVVVSGSNRSIVRLRTDGFVEHVAGGGAAYCRTNPINRRSETGHRDGPGRQALFSGNLSIAVDPRSGVLWVAEDDDADGRTAPNCALRRIDGTGEVSTVRGGQCPSLEAHRANAFRSAGYDRLALDAQGRPLLMSVSRGPREGVGPADLVYTKVHRVDGGGEELLVRAAHGARFEPQGRLEAIGLGPDGSPLAFNMASYSDAGLVTMAASPPLRYAWRSASGGAEHTDGPRGQARILGAQSFCAGTDGKIYVMTAKAVRRIDLATGAVDTWLH